MPEHARATDHLTPFGRLVRPLHVFAGNELAGVALLLGAAVIAMIWANSPAAPFYEALRTTYLTISLGDLELSKPLLEWINDGLMSVFFFVIGLEIKREILY